MLFIDDLAKLLESHGITAKLFTGGVKVYFKINSAEDGVPLQQAVDLIAVWANEWQLSIYTIMSVNVICLILDVLAVN